MKRSWIPILSIIVAAVVAYLMWRLTQDVSQMVSIPVLNSRVAPGTKITPDLVTYASVDEKILQNTPVQLIADPSSLIGKVAFTNILDNTPIFAPQVVDADQYSFAEAKNNYFVSFGLDELNVSELPYNFVKGKITVCMVVQNPHVLNQFPIGLPPEDMETLSLQDIRCPIRNIQAVALTADNMLPWVYMTYDPEAGKYVAGPNASKIGFWVDACDSEEEGCPPLVDENGNQIYDEEGKPLYDVEWKVKLLTKILLRPQATSTSVTKLFFLTAPQEFAREEEGAAVIEDIFTVDPYETFDLIWRPDEIKELAEQGGVQP